MRLIHVLIICIEVCIYITHSETFERSKRFIIYPYGGSYKLVIGVGIPVMLPKHQSLGFASNIQFQYPQITNLTDIQQGLPIIVERRRRNTERKSEWTIAYKALESLLERYGINGTACVLRSICENANYSLYHNGNGLYGQLLHIFLTPNYGQINTDDNINDEYNEARKAGQFGTDCLSLYSDCPLGHNILDMISTLE